MTQESYELTVGSRYTVTLSEEESFDGTFVGYAMIGTESAIVLNMKGDKIRFIPVAQIVYIDLLEAAKPERKDRPEQLYG
jgi:hypothetical protein